MATFIKTLKKGDDVYAPRTVAEAVYLSDGLTDVETALTDLETAIDNIDLTASSVTNTPAGNIASTDVQGAINELDTEKAPLASPSFTSQATIDALRVLVNDNATGTQVLRVWSGTQAQYDAIGSKRNDTLYFIV